MDKERLSKQLVIHEGLRLKPYRCTSDKLTIGVGRNIEDVGISEEESMFLLSNDIDRAYNECYANFTWFSELSELQQEAMVNLIFNMGMSTFRKFKKTIQHMENKEYELAGAELLNSRYAEQVGQRAIEVANQLAEK
jgi:lysozyme|tara:strand:- start:591 stop:1001 length:411 start_codon:yes stop_codon:yes gene_type:complete